MTIGCERILRTIALSGFWLAMFSMNAEAKTKVTSEPFGKTPDGTPVEIFTLNDGAYEARIGTYGGIVVSLKVPDRDGKPAQSSRARRASAEAPSRSPRCCGIR